MKKRNIIFLFFIIFCFSYSQAQKVKNLIIMIPDGTSTSVLSLSRYYKGYKFGYQKNIPQLAIDPYICGLVRTHCSNAPIGDSAPTSSWYATGIASRAGYISMYPPVDPGNDLVEIDSSKTYQPLITVLEIAKLSGKKTGLVFTCQFPHATPADFSAHWYNRSKYEIIAKQMVHNDIDVVFGGGVKYLKKEYLDYLISQNFDVIINDVSRFRNINENRYTKVWSLFGDEDMEYDLDRDNNKEPSLAEMTAKAINILSKNENGFFLMVEGSKVDWAAHGNDPIGIITDFLAFDKAVDTAISFAKKCKNGETIVVVLPDHSTGGVSFGNENSNGKYSKLSLTELFEPLLSWKKTAWGSAKFLAENFKPDSQTIQSLFQKCNPKYVLNEMDINKFMSVYNKYSKSISALQESFLPIIIDIMKSTTYVGFTTKGHTGEDVFLSIYDRNKTNPTGVVRSDDINRYLCKVLGLIDKKGNNTIKDSTEKYFSRHYDVFKDSEINLFKNDTLFRWDINTKSFNPLYKYSTQELSLQNHNTEIIDSYKSNEVILIVKKKNKLLEVPSYKNYYFINGKKKYLRTITIYVDKNDTFYLSKELGNLMN